MIKYVNSKRQEFVLSDYAQVLIKDANFHEKSWSYDAAEMRLGVKIKQFKKDPIEIKIVLKFKGTRDDIVSNLNTFFDITEYDVLNQSEGKLYFNDWYLECYVIEDSTTPDDDYGVEKEITVFAPYPFWIRESKTIITLEKNELISSGSMVLPEHYTVVKVKTQKANVLNITNYDEIKMEGIYFFCLDEKGNQISKSLDMTGEILIMPGTYEIGAYCYRGDKDVTVEYKLYKEAKKFALDYPHDYPYDLLTDMDVATIVNEGVVPQETKILVYGPAINPQVYVGDNEYTVNTTVKEGEILEINTKNKTIKLIGENGKETNVFSLRYPRVNFFKKISVGSNLVMWDGTFGMDVILMEERSMPKWI